MHTLIQPPLIMGYKYINTFTIIKIHQNKANFNTKTIAKIYIRGLIFFALPAIILITTYDIMPTPMPSDMLYKIGIHIKHRYAGIDSAGFLKLISTTYDGFSKKISSMVKLCEEKISKEKSEETKKHINKPTENPKQKKKEIITKPQKKPPITNNVNSITTITKKNIPEKTNEKIPEKKTHIGKTKSSANLIGKRPPERIRGKSIGGIRLQTESGRNTIGINSLTNNIKRKTIVGNKNNKEKDKDNTLNIAPTRNTIGPMPKRSMRTSKSMGKLNNKSTLKKNHEKKKEEIQKMVNEIKIVNKDVFEDEILTEEVKVEIIPPTLMSCYKKGILEKSILQFLTKKEKLELFSCNKTLAKLNIQILNDTITSYKKAYDILIGETIDDKIKQLYEKYTSEELNEPIKNFELSRGAIKAIGLLQGELYMRLFIRPVQEKQLDEIVIIYRIFCIFLGNIQSKKYNKQSNNYEEITIDFSRNGMHDSRDGR